VLWVGVYVDDGRGAIEWGHCVFVSVGISELIHDEYSCMDVSLGVWDAPLTINADESIIDVCSKYRNRRVECSQSSPCLCDLEQASICRGIGVHV